MKRVLSVLLMMVCGVAGGFLFSWAQSSGHLPGSSYFPDMSTTSPHDHDVGYLYEAGVAKGYSDGTYKPKNAVTREQMASYLGRMGATAYILTMLSADWNYHGGYYTGYQAYLDGYLTYDQYLANYNLLNWGEGWLNYEFSQMGAASASPVPISAEQAKQLSQVRAQLARARRPLQPKR